MKILVSRCLLGEACRYDGRSKPCAALEKLRLAGHELIDVCPECDGGLDTPRPPAELQPSGRVVNQEGRDVTAEYRRGAEIALDTARKKGCQAAVLKARSPSCGVDSRYDGSFTGTLIPGQGVTAALLSSLPIRLVDENHIDSLLGGAAGQE